MDKTTDPLFSNQDKLNLNQIAPSAKFRFVFNVLSCRIGPLHICKEAKEAKKCIWIGYLLNENSVCMVLNHLGPTTSD